MLKARHLNAEELTAVKQCALIAHQYNYEWLAEQLLVIYHEMEIWIDDGCEPFCKEKIIVKNGIRCIETESDLRLVLEKLGAIEIDIPA